jgi:membrane associated rhomboid family serine protease
MSLLAYYILHFPKQIIYIFFIPVPAWIVGLFLMGQSLLMFDARQGISNSGHLGGIMAGSLMYFLRNSL